MDQNEKQTKHPFETTLGPGPFQFVGMFTIVKPSPDNPMGNIHTLPRLDGGAGTCAHCGIGIMNIFMIRTDAGKTYGVGSDCIKLLQLDSANMSRVKLAQKRHKRKLELAKAVPVLLAYRDYLAENASKLELLRYGNSYTGSRLFYLQADLTRLFLSLDAQTLTQTKVKKARESAERLVNQFDSLPKFDVGYGLINIDENGKSYTVKVVSKRDDGTLFATVVKTCKDLGEANEVCRKLRNIDSWA